VTVAVDTGDRNLQASVAHIGARVSDLEKICALEKTYFDDDESSVVMV